MRSKIVDYLKLQMANDGFYESFLSSSAISTAVACVALEVSENKNYLPLISKAKNWLILNKNSDGLYGDSPESPSNLTATFLAYVVLSRDQVYQQEIEESRLWLQKYFGDFSFEAVKKGLLKEYGRDLTFSVPLLALATAAGFFKDSVQAWRKMPQFPFEAVILPERLFKYLNLPVVSYAIPALICVGLAQLQHAKKSLFSKIRSYAKAKALKVLAKKQPAGGGFLEAAPLTGFCVLCLCVAKLQNEEVTQKSLHFLVTSQREDGSWPIDRDLRLWVSSLAFSAMANEMSHSERHRCRDLLLSKQTKKIHPFTCSAPGGWGWTTHSGSVPDADDTSAALIALYELGEELSDSVINAVQWLLDLQNYDGGIPTFCRGWGKLPFDRSCPDISAHAYKALSCYESVLPYKLQKKVSTAKSRILNYLEKVQESSGAFLPLWFGDQKEPSKQAPIYGTAVVLEHLHGCDKPFLDKALKFILSNELKDGGWGGIENKHKSIITTARCISALSFYKSANDAVNRAFCYLTSNITDLNSIELEPMGLYFAHLWYSEKL
ncbi:MAG: prenyltransferase/squalene oxidase repeat-containing protein, partial [Lentisphaeria bacterium]